MLEMQEALGQLQPFGRSSHPLSGRALQPATGQGLPLPPKSQTKAGGSNRSRLYCRPALPRPPSGRIRPGHKGFDETARLGGRVKQNREEKLRQRPEPRPAADAGPRPYSDPTIEATRFVASANRPIRLEAASSRQRPTSIRVHGSSALGPIPRRRRPAFCPRGKGRETAEVIACPRGWGRGGPGLVLHFLEGLGPPALLSSAEGRSSPGCAPTCSRQDSGPLLPSLTAPVRPLAPPPLSASSRATQSVGLWSLPVPHSTPQPRPWARPPRRSRGLTRQGEHRVVHFAADDARALGNAIHPQPLVHGLGCDDVVARSGR